VFNPLYKLYKFFLYPFYYFKILLNGLGYKFFFYKKFIYILLGLSHYILFKIPTNIYIKCRKKKIFLISTNNLELFNLYYKFLQIQKLNIYKIKGLYFFKLFILKKYIFFKKGKKQQFM
jgi:ribosomal protein L6P/L9E